MAEHATTDKNFPSWFPLSPKKPPVMKRTTRKKKNTSYSQINLMHPRHLQIHFRSPSSPLQTAPPHAIFLPGRRFFPVQRHTEDTVAVGILLALMRANPVVASLALAPTPRIGGRRTTQVILKHDAI
jgi:hypothetical protein